MKSVSLIHLSWSEVMHEIRMLLSHHELSDPLQVWILAELLKYLENPRSGAVAFHDMGAAWVAAREAVAAGSLRPEDRTTGPVVTSWNRLVRQLGLALTARLGVSVKQSLPRRLIGDRVLRDLETAQKLAGSGELLATFKVPDAAGPITIVADLRTTRIRTSMDILAPQEGKLSGRVGWLTRQLRDAPDDLLVEARFAPRSETTCERLADVRNRPGALIPGSAWEPSAFTVSRIKPMGTKRSGAKGSFVSSVNDAIDDFYTEVVERVRPWTPPAPQLAELSAEQVAAGGVSTTVANATVGEIEPDPNP